MNHAILATSIPQESRVICRSVRKRKPDKSMLTMKILIALGLCSAFGGSGLAFANMDGTQIASIFTAIGTMLVAVVGAWMALTNAKNKARQEEMKLDLEKLRLQQEHQMKMSTINHQSIQGLHSALSHNTIETVKGAQAVDQMKQRVEQLSDKIPAAPTQRIEETQYVDVQLHTNEPQKPKA